MPLPERLRRAHKMSVRFGLTTVDQCVSSLSNFAVGAAVARVAGLEAFGAYSLVYSIWLLLAACHRSLVTDPMAIENDMHKVDAARHVRVGLAAELSLGISAAILSVGIGALLVGLGQYKFGICFIGIAPWLPCLLAQDYWRWVSFMKAQPRKALANDLVFDGVQVATFVVLFLFGVRSAMLAIVAWGVGAAFGAIFGLWQFSARPTLQGGLGRIRLRWGISKWLISTNAVSSATSQSTLVLSGALLGPTGIGALKAALNLVIGPSMVLIQAAGSIGLPEASKSLKERGWPGLRRVQRLITAVSMITVGVIVIAVLCFGRQLLVLVYGPAFGRFAVVADIVAVSFFITTAAHGAILSLKATRKAQRVVPVCACSMVATIVSVVVLAPLFGVIGAAFANLVGNVTRTTGLLIAHWRSSRRTAESMGPASSLVVSNERLQPSSESVHEGVVLGLPAGSDLATPTGGSATSSSHRFLLDLDRRTRAPAIQEATE